MRRLKVESLQEARNDLKIVYEAVLRASRGETTARNFSMRIWDRCERFGNVPRGGRPRDDLDTGLRTVPFEQSALIAYKVEADRVVIVNIFYGGRDFEAFYRDTPVEDEGAE